MFTKDGKFIKRVTNVLFALITLLYCFVSACSCEDALPEVVAVKCEESFSVQFIDVGNGDSIFIRFPDGKTMLIDCGEPSDTIFRNITSVIDAYGVSQIDYLVLTHPDIDHVGNANSVIEKYYVNTAFVPNIYDKQSYTEFSSALSVLQSKGALIKYSSPYIFLEGSGYYLAFLSPCAENQGDYYGEFNSSVTPDDQMVNDLSPIIYLEYAGVRFVFTGDAGVEQERRVLERYDAGIYDAIHRGKVNLRDVDFLKVGHHGSLDCSSDEFLYVLKPRNAVFSVGGNNSYGHPSTITLTRLIYSNPSVNFLRTDVYGTIGVGVSPSGETKIYKQSQ